MSPMSVDVLCASEAWKQLRGPWDEIINMQGSQIGDIDITSGLEWSQTLWEVNLAKADLQVLVVRDGNEVLGIFPLFRRARKIRRLPFREVASLAMVYSGRSGFLVKYPSAKILGAIFSYLKNELDSWDVLNLQFVRGSEHEKLFLNLAQAEGLATQLLQEQVSPFIPFQQDWGSHFASLPNKFRYSIRRGEKCLREQGELSYRECCLPEDVNDFNKAIIEIEFDSWKEAAGSSITANPLQQLFYQVMLPRAAERGFFSGHLLILDGKPIAHLMGLLHNGVFLDLKNSYRSSYRKFSPSHVLMNFACPRLYERNTTLFDFMGNCEEFKTRWTDKVYTRTSYLVFNDNIGGKVGRWISTAVRLALHNRTHIIFIPPITLRGLTQPDQHTLIGNIQFFVPGPMYLFP